MAVGGIEPPSPRLTVCALPRNHRASQSLASATLVYGNVNLGLLMESFLSDVYTHRNTQKQICASSVCRVSRAIVY